MVIGLCVIELHFPEVSSLKGKRQIVNSIKGKIRNRFNVSIAEIDYLDVWQRTAIGATMISNDKTHVNRELHKLINFIEASHYTAYLIDYSIEFL